MQSIGKSALIPKYVQNPVVPHYLHRYHPRPSYYHLFFGLLSSQLAFVPFSLTGTILFKLIGLCPLYLIKVLDNWVLHVHPEWNLISVIFYEVLQDLAPYITSQSSSPFCSFCYGPAGLLTISCSLTTSAYSHVGQLCPVHPMPALPLVAHSLAFSKSCPKATFSVSPSGHPI